MLTFRRLPPLRPRLTPAARLTALLARRPAPPDHLRAALALAPLPMLPAPRPDPSPGHLLCTLGNTVVTAEA
jgi:hypothetical protein